MPASPELSRHRITRRRFLGVMAASAVVGGGSLAHARLFEPGWLEVTRQRVDLRHGLQRSPLRVLHLSDLHASKAVPLRLIAEAVALGLAAAPDLIVLTGDFVTGRYAQWAEYQEVLRPLRAAAPCFACLGNHDGGVWSQRGGHGFRTSQQVQKLLQQTGIELLHNRTVDLALKGQAIRLTGVGDLWSGECQPLMAFPEESGDTTVAGPLRLVLNHNPDAKDLFGDYPWDLMFCGHTHGGQLRLPLIGTPFAPVRDKRYVAGLNAWEGRQIFTTRGVGNLHGVRFNCRPEVSLLDLSGGNFVVG